MEENKDIVLKVQHLNDAAFHAGIRKLANFGGYPTFGATFNISKICKKIASETMEMNSVYRGTLAQMLDEKGEVKPEFKEEYAERLKEMMNTDIEIATEAGPLKKIPLSFVTKVGLTPAEVVTLEPILDLSSFPLEAV